MTLFWIPGHSQFKGNEIADDLARQAAATSFVGPEPALGLQTSTVRRWMNDWSLEEHSKHWISTPKLRQSKLFLTGPRQWKVREILNLSRKQLRAVVGLFTGHCQLNRHLSILKIVTDDLCRECGLEQETPEHILCECLGLAGLRFAVFGTGFLRPEYFQTCPLRQTLAFISKTGLLEV